MCIISLLHCYSSGAAGGSNKGPAVVDKRNQVLVCPHCDREFKQLQRYREHIARHHPDVSAADAAESATESVPGASKASMFSTIFIAFPATSQPVACFQLPILGQLLHTENNSPSCLTHARCTQSTPPANSTSWVFTTANLPSHALYCRMATQCSQVVKAVTSQKNHQGCCYWSGVSSRNVRSPATKS